MPSIFVSFKYKDDCWRVQQILNAGVVEGQQILNPNDWEEVKRKGYATIVNWIDEQMKNKKCVVVMVGKNTSSSHWVKYEIEKAFQMGKPVIAIHINNLKDKEGNQSSKGSLPTTAYNSKIISYTSPYLDSQSTYNYIANNIANWINNAISSKSYTGMF